MKTLDSIDIKDKTKLKTLINSNPTYYAQLLNDNNENLLHLCKPLMRPVESNEYV